MSRLSLANASILSSCTQVCDVGSLSRLRGISLTCSWNAWVVETASSLYPIPVLHCVHSYHTSPLQMKLDRWCISAIAQEENIHIYPTFKLWSGLLWVTFADNHSWSFADQNGLHWTSALELLKLEFWEIGASPPGTSRVGASLLLFWSKIASQFETCFNVSSQITWIKFYADIDIKHWSETLRSSLLTGNLEIGVLAWTWENDHHRARRHRIIQPGWSFQSQKFSWDREWIPWSDGDSSSASSEDRQVNLLFQWHSVFLFQVADKWMV